MGFLLSWLRCGKWRNMMVSSMFLLSLLPGQAFAQTADISVSVTTPVPDFSLSSPSEGALELLWDWDTVVSPGYVPPGIVEMQVETSLDGVNYSNFQSHLPGDFQASYSSLAGGNYTVRVTIIDGNDLSYVVGPVSVSSSGGGARRGDRGGGGGGDDGSGDDGADSPAAPTSDVTINGLAYPGPTTVVIFTFDGGFQTSILTDPDGFFTYNTSALPIGTGTFSFTAQDPDGRLSPPISIPVTIPSDAPLVLDVADVLLPPTIEMSAAIVTGGDTVLINGFGYKDGEVSLTLTGLSPVSYLVQADSNGAWILNLDTVGLDPGTYTIFATPTSDGGTYQGPDSEVLNFEIVPALPSAPVCGDGLVQTPEECDDSNTTDGDGCSSLCQLEIASCGDGTLQSPPEQCDDGNTVSGDGCSASCQQEGLPVSQVLQPDPDVVVQDFITLSYTATSPNGAIDFVELYYSRDGLPYQQYAGTFTAGSMSLIDLEDGVYDVYSIATDTQGAVELPPAGPDAQFTIDVDPDFEVHAYPDKRVPATGNWGMDLNLSLYQGGDTPAYEWDKTTNDSGWVRIDVDSSFVPATYDALVKGKSHLSRRLDNVDMRDLTGLQLDFTDNASFFLTPGDVHPSKDDFINAMDISSLLGTLYSSDANGDLNRDTTVNALDLSIMLGNLYKSGDGIQ